MELVNSVPLSQLERAILANLGTWALVSGGGCAAGRQSVHLNVFTEGCLFLHLREEVY